MKKKACLWIVFVLGLMFGGLAYGAAALDNATTTTATSVTSISRSHTFTGSNGLLLAGIHDYNVTVSNCDYGGAALGGINSATRGAMYVEMWSRTAPAAGAHTLTCNFSGTTAAAVLIISTFTGVDQVTPLGSPGSTDALSNSISLNITGATGGLAVSFMTVDTDTPTSSNTPVASNVASFVNGAMSSQAGTGTLTMGWTWAGSQYAVEVGVLINQATAGAAIKHKVVMQ